MMSKKFAHRNSESGTLQLNNVLLGSARRSQSPKSSEATIEPFPRQLSEMLQVYSNEYESLADSFERLEAVSRAVAFPARKAHRLEKSLDAITGEMENTSAGSTAENLLLQNMSERLSAMRAQLSVRQKNSFDYRSVMALSGIGDDDVASAAERYMKINTQKIAETRMGAIEKYEAMAPESTEQAQQVKELYIRLLRLSFEMAPQKIRTLFNNFEDYMQRVNFVEDGSKGTYMQDDMIYLNVYQPGTIVKIKKGNRWASVPDAFVIADIVGEEGLLGHQGHFLLANNAKIPEFMKTYHDSSVINVHAETVVELGKLRLVDRLKNNRESIPELDSDDFDLLLDNFEVEQRLHGVGAFAAIYEDYVYFTQGHDSDKAAKAIFSILGDPTVLTDIHKNKQVAYYNTGFWDEFEHRIGNWVYIAAEDLAGRFSRRLEGLSQESQDVVLEQLQLGFWPRRSLEAYFDYLVGAAQND